MDPRIRSLITGMIANRRRRRSDLISQRVAKLLENIAAFSSAGGVIAGKAAANELLARADIWLTLAREALHR